MLEDIWRDDAEEGRAILTWLFFSKRPLTLQVAEAAVVKPGDTPIDPEACWTLLRSCVSAGAYSQYHGNVS